MSIIGKLSDRQVWESYYAHKSENGNISAEDSEDLRRYIDSEEYMPVVSLIENGEKFPYPKKVLLNKSASSKKRAVYIFGRQENYVLKLMAFLLREYDGIFSENLYSFRKDAGVKNAVKNVVRIKNLREKYVYKADVSDYFNSVDVSIILPRLKEIFSEDRTFYEFLRKLLTDPYVEYEGRIIEEHKGIMAGVALSAFLANVYLMELDRLFYEKRIAYMRYSDDILVFADNEIMLEESIHTIKDFLSRRKLKINPDKESVSRPHEKWEFLGFSYYEGVIDISDVSFEKLKGKMRRKARALARWAEKKNLPSEYAARAFIKRFNAKLYDNPVYSELTWARWFFPVINTDTTLKKADEYMQDCVRYLATGKRNKSRFDFRYDDIKKLGYRSLVNEYYKFKKGKYGKE